MKKIILIVLFIIPPIIVAQNSFNISVNTSIYKQTETKENKSDFGFGVEASHELNQFLQFGIKIDYVNEVDQRSLYTSYGSFGEFVPVIGYIKMFLSKKFVKPYLAVGGGYTFIKYQHIDPVFYLDNEGNPISYEKKYSSSGNYFTLHFGIGLLYKFTPVWGMDFSIQYNAAKSFRNHLIYSLGFNFSPI